MTYTIPFSYPLNSSLAVQRWGYTQELIDEMGEGLEQDWRAAGLAGVTPLTQAPQMDKSPSGVFPWVVGVTATVSGPLLAYHGYKRTGSLGWAAVWFLLGGVFWPVALPVALAQGFGKPEKS